MAEYIERSTAIKSAVEMIDNGLAATSEDLAAVLAGLTAADVVSRAAYDQAVWERDLAIWQLQNDFVWDWDE